MSMFGYRLKPAQDCSLPLGPGNTRDLVWFWLTDGYYWLNVGDVQLFKTSAEWNALHPESHGYAEYQCARLVEDLLELLPQLMEALPPELYSFISTVQKYEELSTALNTLYARDGDLTPELNNACDVVGSLLWHGRLNTGHFAHNARCCFYHNSGSMHVQYDFRGKTENAIPPWAAGTGMYTLPFADFITEVEDLLLRFFLHMDRQIEQACKLLDGQGYSAYGETGHAAKELLRAEHARRKEYFYSELEHCKQQIGQTPTNWAATQAAAELVLQAAQAR